ncbi:NUDIX hydrolase [Nocardioides acrostichi]|uniref:CoA pyrophosphatase n=1 Tax=Nocardioides acrostichi TaxID=2784339 RepID=A0A930V0P5_9ACTN|nr:CoA pyrophosphatase [Nocardioides acrostichi]MBF4163227.1 CoA pyrophosphatase [Nocardioides acrostichi]
MRASLPEWLHPVREAAATIDGTDLTRFLPPDDGTARPGAVLMLFGEGEQGGEILLTERAHDMRSHPGQVSFPGGSLDPGETVEQAALREAREEVDLDADEVTLFGRLPELWLPPSNFAVTPVLGWWGVPGDVRIASRAEVHAIHRAPIAELLDPEHRVMVRHPRGYESPGFLVGPDKDVIVWGFTGGIINRLFDYLGWTLPWDDTRVRELPEYMLAADHRYASRREELERDLDLTHTDNDL